MKGELESFQLVEKSPNIEVHDMLPQGRGSGEDIRTIAINVKLNPVNFLTTTGSHFFIVSGGVG